MNYWLLKTEPESFSIDDLAAAKNRTTYWDGVRNYQARNFMRTMQVGDRALFYHSNAEPPAVVGTATICREAYPDFTQFDPANKHFDPKASVENPIWDMVDIRWEGTFATPISLERLRQAPELEGMELLRRGSRLSVQPVSQEHFETVLALAEQMAADEDAREAPAPREKSKKRAVKAAGKKTAQRKKAKQKRR